MSITSVFMKKDTSSCFLTDRLNFLTGAYTTLFEDRVLSLVFGCLAQLILFTSSS